MVLPYIDLNPPWVYLCSPFWTPFPPPIPPHPSELKRQSSLNLFYFTTLYWFCHTFTWICHGCTCVPHPEPPCHLPPHPIPLGQCTSPKHPVSCIEPGLAIHFTYNNLHVSMPFSHIIPPSPSPTKSKRLFNISVSVLLSCIQDYHYHLSKFHIYALVYCIGAFLSDLPHSV